MKQNKQLKLLSLLMFSMLFLLMTIGPVTLQASDEVLPKAEKILDGFIEATGGLAAYEKIDNRVTKGTMEMTGMGIKLFITAYNARPNKSYSVVESDATGKVETGTDGNVVWENSAAQGAQIKEGKERAQFLKINTFDRMVYWRKAFTKVECTGVEDIEGTPCYKVVATPVDGDPEIYFFDKETNLLIKSEMTMESQVGTIKGQMFPGDYEKFDGILVPKSTKLVMRGMEMAMTMTSIEHNVKLPEDIFALPPEIQALLDKKKEEKKEKVKAEKQ